VNRRLENELKRWLRAEAQGRAEEAEQRLASVFRMRPEERLPEDLAARTMARLGARAFGSGATVRARAPVSLFLDWAFKIGVAASVLLAGVSAVLLSGMVVAFTRNGGSEQAVGWGIGLLAAASEQVARSIALWSGLDRVAGAMASAMLSPESLGAVTVGLLISLFAFRWLSQLVVIERSASHV